ncbi:MAG: fumarylacetoacetate hydrolase family protein [Acidobacteriota bacterium]|nr:fumarylacetoacetate hydrolase family protein [Acidobacteriota bacterium]
MKTVHGALVAAGLAAIIGMAHTGAQTAEPYKLGMFQQGGRSFVGMVIRKDTLVVDLSRANVGAPATLKQLIAQWDINTGTRLALLAATSALKAPAFSMKVSEVKTLPPIPDPAVLLNAAVNYSEHGIEMTGVATSAASADKVDPKVAMGIPAYWNRKPGDPRHNPYYFLKAPTSITGNGDPIMLPPGRTQIDWECELNIVIGKTAKRVKAENAAEYIFGYTLDNDVSDRGGRADGRHGSDWMLGKSHDTFFPMGPYIVPRQFVPNPQKLAIKFSLSGKVMQDSNTDRMTHNVYELVEFASHMLTLKPGDMISSGSPAGVGTARGTPIYFKDGDTSSCTIESIGTLENPVRAEK